MKRLLLCLLFCAHSAHTMNPSAETLPATPTLPPYHEQPTGDVTRMVMGMVGTILIEREQKKQEATSMLDEMDRNGDTPTCSLF